MRPDLWGKLIVVLEYPFVVVRLCEPVLVEYPRRIHSQCFFDVSLLSVPCTCVHVSLTALGVILKYCNNLTTEGRTKNTHPCA